MAKFSESFFESLRGAGRRGSPTDPMLQRQAGPQYGSTDPLARSLGGMLGMDMRTAPELAAAELSKVDQTDPKSLIQALGVQAKYEQDPQKKVLYMLEIDKIRKSQELQKQTQTQSGAFRDSLVKTLTDKKQTGLANIVRNIPDFDKLPAEAQNRILSAAGITSIEDQQKALSPQGKLAADMGFIPGTQDFYDKVEQISKFENQTGSAEVLKSFTSAVNTLVPLEKTAQVNNAVVALAQGDKPGADTIQLEAIMAIAGSKQRAEAAYKRLEQSASIDERVANLISKFFTGEVTELTFEAREFLVYSALQQQKQALDQVVSNTATTLSVPENKVKSIRALFDFTDSTKEWQSRFEKKYFPNAENKGTPEVKSPDEIQRRANYNAQAAALHGSNP